MSLRIINLTEMMSLKSEFPRLNINKLQLTQ